MISYCDKVQDWLVRYLADTLDLNPDDIGETTLFTHYGLDSSSTAILTAELMDWLGVEIALDDVYQYPTIEKLSQYLSEKFSGEHTDS